MKTKSKLHASTQNVITPIANLQLAAATTTAATTRAATTTTMLSLFIQVALSAVD